MARKPRIEFEGALYHVIVRGNQRQRIFRDTKDYEQYLKLLADYKIRYTFWLYGYVLMNSHVHLLLEVGKIPLSKVLQGINQSYTMYFNRRYKTVGHLFQGRYKAILCDKDAYLVSLVKYIHLNPIRAGVVRTLDSYRWSSHGVYAGGEGGSGLVDEEQVLRMFSEDKRRARRAYRVYMGQVKALGSEEVYATVDQRILGDERFVKELAAKTGNGKIGGKRRHGYTLSQIGEAVEEVCGITIRQLRDKGRDEGLGSGRRVMSLAAKDYGYRGQEIAEYLQRDPSVITRYLKEGGKFEAEAERVHELLLKRVVNKQV